MSNNPSRHSLIEPIFIGIAGRRGAGKTSAAQHLSSAFGFQYTRYSQVLKKWLSDGSDIDRLQDVGWNVMSGGLQVELNSRLIAGLNCSRSAAIDGLRHPIDVKQLSSAFGSSFRLVFLETREQLRFDRQRLRFSTYAAFQSAESHPVEGHIDSLKPLASATISNEDSLEALYRQLDTLMVRGGEEKS